MRGRYLAEWAVGVWGCLSVLFSTLLVLAAVYVAYHFAVKYW